MNTAFNPEWAQPYEWATLYRENGIQVVPAHAPDPRNPAFQWKRPALPEWKTVQDAIVPDLTFQRWYARGGEYAARYQMGIVTGACSGNIGVVDLDDQKTAAADLWWRGLLSVHNHDIEPETWEQVTGGGGRQLLFRFPAGYTIPTIKTGIGVDIRGQGGFAMLPPSKHASGKDYDWKEGRSPYETTIEEAPEWLCEAILTLWEEHGGTSQAGRVKTEGTRQVNDWGRDIDNREEKMTRMVWAALINCYRDAPIPPGERDARDAFDVYERTTASRLTGPGTNAERLEQEGRGWSAFYDKWRYAMKKWDAEISEEAAKDPPVKDEPQEQPAPPPTDVYKTLSLADIDALPPPTWLVEGVIPETGLTFVYGKPGKGKSFIILDLALRVAHGFDWHGLECRQGGVLYIAGEGKGGYRNRVRGWHTHHGLVPDCAPFQLLPQSLNFMDDAAVAKLVRTVKAVVGDAKVVVIDTVARVLPGAEENASKEMGLFVAACDAIREECNVAVIGVHHSGKDEERGMRGSTALEGAGDCVIRLKREDESDTVELVVEKQKDGEMAKPIAMRMKKVEWLDGLKPASTLVPVISVPQDKKDHLDKAACRKVIAEVGRAWGAGKPWSNSPQTRRDGRYLPKWMASSIGCSFKEAESMIAEWLQNDVLAIDQVDKRMGLKGLKVAQGLD